MSALTTDTTTDTDTDTDTGLYTETRDGVSVVVDPQGGVWWPHEATLESEDLVRKCQESPMTGEWRQ